MNEALFLGVESGGGVGGTGVIKLAIRLPRELVPTLPLWLGGDLGSYKTFLDLLLSRRGNGGNSELLDDVTYCGGPRDTLVMCNF